MDDELLPVAPAQTRRLGADRLGRQSERAGVWHTAQLHPRKQVTKIPNGLKKLLLFAEILTKAYDFGKYTQLS